MKNYGILLLLLLFLEGCSAMGNKTFYREPKTDTMIKNIAVVNMVADSANINICPTIAALSDSVIKKVLLGTNDFTYEYFDYKASNVRKFYNKSTEFEKSTAEFCHSNNLDGALFVSMKFIDAKMTVALIPVLSEWHAESIMFLYGKDGKKLLSTGHNTLHGDTSFDSPNAEQRAKDAIQLGLEWTMRETKKLNQRSGY